MVATEGFDKMKILDIPSSSGDDCHTDLQQIENSDSETFATNNCKPPYIYVCNGAKAINVDEVNFKKLKEWIKSSNITCSPQEN